MKKNRFRIMLILGLISVFLVGCGKKGMSKSELDEYTNGIKIVDLLDESSYAQDGDNMVKALEKVINTEIYDYHMLEQKAELLSKETSFKETYDKDDNDFYYVGDMKDDKPHGWGVLLSIIGDDMKIHYIGQFKKGTVKDCYGMTLEKGFYTGGELVTISCEGILNYLSKEELVASPADGEIIRTYKFDDVKNSNVQYDELGLEQFTVIKCTPKYVGEIKKGEYWGEGVLYYPNGTIKYEGEFKRGAYNGKGTLYSESGKIVKAGTFKSGELKDGEYYRENDN